jgi:hypothetical protein
MKNPCKKIENTPDAICCEVNIYDVGHKRHGKSLEIHGSVSGAK